MKSQNSVFLRNGRSVVVLGVFPKMKVARVHTADGQTRTIKLSELQPARTRPIADMRNVPVMGHEMTANAPSVRRAKVEAAPVRGQTPTIKVKQEPAEVQATLTQPPAPVGAADAARVGQRDPQSGRTILQPSNDLVQNERLANQAAPELNTRLSRVAASIQGLRNGSAGDALALRSRKASAHSALTRVDRVKFDRLRPQKGLKRLQEKVADGKPANTIGDNLAAQIVAPTVKAKDQIIAELHREFPVISVDDKFLEAREKAGYPSANVQVRMRNGSTAEVQIVAPEIQKKTDLTHRLYTLGRNYPENSPERAYYWDQAAAIHMQALERFHARTTQQPPTDLAQGQRVMLRDGQTGKVVGFADKTSRIVVRTSKGLRTVRAQDVLSRIELAPKRSLSTPDFGPRDLKKFTGKVESRLGAPEAQRGEIVLLNADALHEIQKAMKDHNFAGVTLSGDIADDVIAKIRARADKTGHEDLDLLADHLERAKSQYGVVPLALEGSDEAKNISAELEERIHGGQADMGKGDILNYGDAKRDYAHPKTALFVPWLESRGVDPNDKVMAVAEIADLILRKEHSEAGVSDEDAEEWLNHHRSTLEDVHGPDAVEKFRQFVESLMNKARTRRNR